MTDFNGKMRLKEAAEEDIYFARRDRELIRALHEEDQPPQHDEKCRDKERQAGKGGAMSTEIFFYRYLLNPLMRGLLRSPMHKVASNSIAILHFRGRQSGRWLNTPLSYMRDGNTVRLLPSNTTHWWRNLRNGPVEIELEIQGSRFQGAAKLFEGDSEVAREGIRKFIAAVPRDARVYGLELDSDKQLQDSSLAAKIAGLVLVEIELA